MITLAVIITPALISKFNMDKNQWFEYYDFDHRIEKYVYSNLFFKKNGSERIIWHNYTASDILSKWVKFENLEVISQWAPSKENSCDTVFKLMLIFVFLQARCKESWWTWLSFQNKK